MTIIRWTIAFFVVLAATSLLAAALTMFAGSNIPSCGNATPELCAQFQQLAIDQASFRAGVIGIALSAVGTLALVVTIFLSARATEAAVAAAKAANVAVDLARETAVRELRPYMAFDTFYLRYTGTPETSATDWLVMLTWCNRGNSSALEVLACANHAIVTEDLPDDFDFPDRAVNRWVGTIGKEGSFNSPAGVMSLEDVQQVLDGTARLFVWGWVEYEGFEAGQTYRTEWHSEITLWDGPASNPALRSNNLLRQRFNGADARSFRPPIGAHNQPGHGVS